MRRTDLRTFAQSETNNRDFGGSIVYSPRHPVILSENDWGVQLSPKPIVLRFHDTIRSFGVPGSLGFS